MDVPVLVTGASGLLGRAVLAFLREKGYSNVSGTALSRTGPGLHRLDLTDAAAVAAFVAEHKPKVVVHAAAQRFVEKVAADPDAASKINVEATRALASSVNSIGGHVLYISTDYVFDGKNPPYAHDAPTNPVNLYGQTKLQGEQVVLAVDPTNMVLRVPVLYGPVEYLGESAVTVLLDTLRKANTAVDGVAVSDVEVRRPAHVRDIASVIQQLIKTKIESGDAASVSGVFQWCGSEALTKYEMVQAMAAELSLDATGVRPDAVAATPSRPKDVTMDRSRLEALGVAADTPFAQGIREVLLPWVDK